MYVFLNLQKSHPSHVLEQLRNPASEDLSFDLICELTKHICLTKGPGAILIFLPGLMDINKLTRMLLDCGSFPRGVLHNFKTAELCYEFISLKNAQFTF